MTQAKLAKRLGISRQAVSKAALAGKITLLASGDVDMNGTATKAYVSAFSLRRGKQREPEAPSPEAAEALRHKLRAMFARQAARIARRKAGLIEAAAVDALLSTMQARLVDELQALPARANLAAEHLERELEGLIVDVLRAVKAAGHAVLARPIPEATAPALPATLPEDAPVADLRAYLDFQHAERHDLERVIESGALIARELAAQRIGRFEGGPLQACRGFPRRSVAEMQALLASEGQEAARARLAASIQTDLIRSIQ